MAGSGTGIGAERTDALRVPPLRLAAALWLLSMLGVATLSLTVVPQLLARLPQAVPVPLAVAMSIAQSAVLVALAAWGGAMLARPLGLRAPVVESLLAGADPRPALRRQLVPGAIAGLLAAAWLVLLGGLAPPSLASAGTAVQVPMAAKLLYGGVTEEVLMRWGLMTVLVWLLARAWRRTSAPRAVHYVLAAIGAAAVFGMGHLPAVVAVGVEPDARLVAYVLLGNAVPGTLFGLLYWRRGLESAVLAHALAHAASAAWMLAAGA